MTDSLERETERPDGRSGARPSPKARLRRPSVPVGRAGWAVRAALPIALGLWLIALPGTRLERMGDLGLLQALPPVYFAALALLTAGFIGVLRSNPVRQGWAAAYVLGLIAMIHATPSILYPTLRYSWAWKHIAVVDAMLRHNGAVPDAGKLDVYNQWPGFFQLNGLFLRVTGLHSALGYASWYPVVANVLLLGPLLLLYRSVTKDRRLVWGGVWLYCSTAWVGQDYFSPQAFAYLLYVTVVALVVRRLSASRAAASAGPAGPGARALPGLSGDRNGGGWPPGPFLVLVVLIAAIVSSHQLTPIMLISALLLLALPRRNRRTALPVLVVALAMTLAWDATVARPFVSTNLGDFLTALGSPDRNAVAGLAPLGSAAPGQVISSWGDRGLTALMLLLAVVAVIRLRWVRPTGLPALVIAPLLLLFANGYGGEMLFRAYLFALPAAALLGAALLWRTRPERPLRVAATGVVLCGLLGGMLLGYFGKEAMNHFTPQEAAATRLVTDTPPGSTIVSLTSNVPGGEMHYEEHEWIPLADGTPDDQRHLVEEPGAVLESTLAGGGEKGPTYLIITRSQTAECELTGLLPTATVRQLVDLAAHSGMLRPVFTGDDAVVYQYVPDPARSGGITP